MSIEKTCKKELNKNLTCNIMRWLLFGVFFVVAPSLFNVWFRMIIGFEIDYIEYIPDILLAVLSVCCNLINTCIDGEKSLYYILRWLLGVVLGIIASGCWGFFFIIRFVPRTLIKTYIYNSLLKDLVYFASVVILVCFFVGVIIEVCTARARWRLKNG